MITNLQKYPAYKDSGTKWLGNIPSHWNTLSNKNIFKLKKNQVGKKSADYVLLSLTLNGVIKRDMENPQGKFPAEFNTYQEVKKGDFIFCLFDVEETPRCVGLSDFDGMITGAYTVMEPYANFDRNFLYYFYLNLDADKRLKPLYTGLRNTISKENFFSFKTFVPPHAEQTAIAAFLDRKTALIDQAINIKQKQIELLKERRQIIIHKAVTRGLNPDVKMKDSGVEWIGEIPEHWEVKRLGVLTDVIDPQPDHRAPKMDDNGLPYLGIRDINDDGSINIYTARMVDIKAIEKQERAFTLNDGDILYGKVGTLGNPKRVILGGERVALSATLVIIKNKNELLTRYLKYALDCYMLYAQIEKIITGATRPALGIQQIRKFQIVIPNVIELEDVVRYLENSTEKIATSISLKEQEIEKLKEYKASLINSAVTGKIKVC